jgi:hypothetical protein
MQRLLSQPALEEQDAPAGRKVPGTQEPALQYPIHAFWQLVPAG